MSHSTSAVTVSFAKPIAAFAQPAPGALPMTYVETDSAQCGQAKVAHLCGIFGIVGTGIYYFLKREGAGAFAKDQMKEAFNFHALVFTTAIALSIVTSVAAAVIGRAAAVLSLLSLALMVGALVLSVLNALKASKGQVARYPARINVLK